MQVFSGISGGAMRASEFLSKAGRFSPYPRCKRCRAPLWLERLVEVDGPDGDRGKFVCLECGYQPVLSAKEAKAQTGAIGPRRIRGIVVRFLSVIGLA